MESYDQLERDVKVARMENDELDNLLNEENMKRELLETELDQHKTYLQDRIVEVEEKDRTISTQSFLLNFAWEDAQEKENLICHLRNQLAAQVTESQNDNSATASIKKRRLSP